MSNLEVFDKEVFDTAKKQGMRNCVELGLKTLNNKELSSLALAFESGTFPRLNHSYIDSMIGLGWINLVFSKSGKETNEIEVNEPAIYIVRELITSFVNQRVGEENRQENWFYPIREWIDRNKARAERLIGGSAMFGEYAPIFGGCLRRELAELNKVIDSSVRQTKKSDNADGN